MLSISTITPKLRPKYVVSIMMLAFPRRARLAANVLKALAAVKTFAASLAFISLLAILPAIFFDLL